MSLPSGENLRSRIEGNSSAMRFGVVHLGSRNMEFEGCPAARCASSLASSETISLAVAAASAGHRKGVKGTKVHRPCNRHRQTLGLPGRIVNAADRRLCRGRMRCDVDPDKVSVRGYDFREGQALRSLSVIVGLKR